jgi:hypothetical protein
MQVASAMALRRVSAISRSSRVMVRTVPRRVTREGITLKALEEDSTEVTETTIWLTGSALRLTMLWSARTRWEAVTVGSTVSCGLAAWPPRPSTVISNWSVAAKKVPARMAKLPTGRPGQLCIP